MTPPSLEGAHVIHAAPKVRKRAPLHRPSEVEETRSPRPSRAQGFALELEQRCGQGDHALALTAHELARAQLERGQSPDSARVLDALRAVGAPYVWPRAWTRRALVTERDSTAARMSNWLGSFEDAGERRCGIAIESRGTEELVAVVAVDTLAHLRPIPRWARLASWIDVEAEMLVPAAGAKVVVLGPRGLPRSVPTSVSNELVHARFNADQPGPWLVQVLADVDGGPRPVLEARVFAGEEPHANAEPSTPGEVHLADGADPELALGLLLSAARRDAGLPKLRRDPRLDRLAREHAESMRQRRRIAHDVGDGDPATRVGQAGLPVASVGENVAHAPNTVRAQRALWSSPSHRANLLSAHFDAVGIGVAADDDGSIWVCELFTRLINE